MARKWSTLNLHGALHYFTGNFLNRLPVFTEDLWVGKICQSLLLVELSLFLLTG